MQTKEDKSPSPKAATTFKSHPKTNDKKPSSFDIVKPANDKPPDAKLNASEPEISQKYLQSTSSATKSQVPIETSNSQTPEKSMISDKQVSTEKNQSSNKKAEDVKPNGNLLENPTEVKKEGTNLFGQSPSTGFPPLGANKPIQPSSGIDMSKGFGGGIDMSKGFGIANKPAQQNPPSGIDISKGFGGGIDMSKAFGSSTPAQAKPMFGASP